MLSIFSLSLSLSLSLSVCVCVFLWVVSGAITPPLLIGVSQGFMLGKTKKSAGALLESQK
jgi:hypothetical protein